MRMTGTIVRGKGEGRGLGYPTANMQPATPLRPAAGVYAARAALGGGAERPAAAVVGMWRLPTGAPSVEVHVIGGDLGDQYGQQLDVRLIKKIRGLRSFSSPTDLINRIQEDVGEIKKILNV